MNRIKEFVILSPLLVAFLILAVGLAAALFILDMLEKLSPKKYTQNPWDINYR